MSRPGEHAKTPRLRVRLRPAAETQVRAGHPWVFAESIREQNRPGTCGELAIIFDRNDQFLAAGLFDPASPLRIRVLHRGNPTTIDGHWWRERFAAALSRRLGILDSTTTACRLINGESDQFPALVLDRYAETLVLKLYSAIWFPHLESILLPIIRETLPSERLVLRLSRNLEGAHEILHDGQVLFGAPVTGPVHFLETGLTFEADVLKGQKTGFFLDQRENRRIVESSSSGRHVLNAFSFSGGFSLYAARGGALSVTDVDISEHALESSRRNFSANSHPRIRSCDHRLIRADVFEWLARQQPRSYDLIVLDPPSLAKRHSDRDAALRAYTQLASIGVRLARREGIVVCCSCSGHVRRDEFYSAVLKGAWAAGKLTVLQKTAEPPDHPATFPEAQYLKSIYLRIDQ